MTATPPVPPSVKKQSLREQRAAERARKLEEFKKREARAKRIRRIVIWSSVAAVVAVLGLLVTAIALTPQPPSYTVGGEGTVIDGVETFDNVAGHVEGVVAYPQTPPTGGEHNQLWLNCGIYEQPVPNENAVHSLEHGAIWVTYDPEIAASELDALRAKLPSTYVILSPFDGLPSPIVLSGWNTQLQLDAADDPRIATFFEEYWQSRNAPEPGAPCTGAFDAPGKVS